MAPQRHVLIVDDEINLCRIVGAKLARSGFRVTAVHDATRAIEHVRTYYYDLVIFDLILPDASGLVALAELRRIAADVPVILVTAYDDRELLNRARSYGIVAYITKPFDLDLLAAVVEKNARGRGRISNAAELNASALFSRGRIVTIETLNGRSCARGQVLGLEDQSVTVTLHNSSGFERTATDGTCVRVGLATQGGFYTFTSRILEGCSKRGLTTQLTLQKPEFVYRVQRRQYDRFAVSVPVDYVVVSPGGTRSETANFGHGEAKDIGLGGLRIATVESLKPGSIVNVKMSLISGTEAQSGVARVLRSVPCEPCYHWSWMLGCRFEKVDSLLIDFLARRHLPTIAD